MSDYTADEIAQAISDMQAAGASPADIAQAAANAGVSVSEIAAATGIDAGSIQSVFDTAGITAPPDPGPVAPVSPAPVDEPAAPVAPVSPAPVDEPPAPVYEPPAPVAPVSPEPTVQDNVNTWFQQNPNATPTDVLQAIQAAGGMTSDIAAAVANHYGTDVSAVQDYYTANMPAPVTPVAQPEPIKEAPVAPVEPDNVSTNAQPTGAVAPSAPAVDLSAYNEQTQAAVKNAGLDTTMNTVTGGGNLTDIVNQGLTPQAVGAYKDASGTMIQAAPNTFVVSNPDGSGGALNYFFTVDPNTGTTAPIADPAQNLTYTPGSPGGFINGLVSQAGDIVKTVAPIALDVALIANGVDPVTAGAITGSTSAAANGGGLGDIAKGAVVGGAAGYVGGAASNAVGAGSPVLSGIAGGSAGGATAAALTGQNIVSGAATGGIIGGGAGAVGLGNIAQNAVDTAADTADINNALKTFNAANPGASPTAQADFLIHDPDLGSFSTQQISTALGASNPITQAAAVIDQTYALNGQEVTAGQQSSTTPSGTVAPAAPAQPAWTQDLANAYNSKDWTTVDNIIKSNGLTTDQIAQTYNITNPSTLANIQDIVTNGAGTSLDTVNVTGSSAGTNAPTPPVVTAPAVPNTPLDTVNVTGSSAGVTAPATPPVVTAPAVPNTPLDTVNVTGTKDTGVTTPATPPVVTAPPVPTPSIGPTVGPDTLPSIEVTGTKDTGVTAPPTPPVVTAPAVPNVDLNPITVTAPKDTGVTTPPTPPVVPVVPNVDLNPITVTAPKDTGITAPPTPPVVTPPIVPVVTPPAPPVTPIVNPTPPVVVPPVTPTPPTTPTTPVTSTLPPVVVTPPGKLVSPGLNPGWMNLGASKPFYNTTNPTQSQFYWGAHPYMNVMEDLKNYNVGTNAPTTPWGATNSAVGGQSNLNVPAFIQQYITNPAYAGVNNATGPGYMPTLDQMSLSSLLNASKQ